MLPIIELIVQDLKDTLAGVQQAAGYHIDLTVTEEEPSEGNVPADGLCVLYRGDSAEEESPVNFQQRLADFAVKIYAYEPQGNGEATGQRLGTAAADAAQALNDDYTRGGYAIDTLIGVPTYSDDRQSIVLPVQVRYRTRFNNPFSQE